MKSILMSMHPKWCELIANGKKTIEVRKTKPKSELPFKVYIYCTKGIRFSKNYYQNDKLIYSNKLNGKVIGEFICNEIECFTTDYRRNEEQTARISRQSCISFEELSEYECNDRMNCLYGYHIYNLKLYDKPKNLFNFYRYCTEKDSCDECLNCHYDSFYDDMGHCVTDSKKYLTRPPQSWCYVEGVEE